MNRNPPSHVKKILRAEIGFGCPVPECGRPYLEWHHFDPPWNIENHHNPNGMIALCREHHIQADNGAFTIEQLRTFKLRAKENWRMISGQFNWLRNRLLIVLGGCFYYETPVVIESFGRKVIWYERDDDNYILLNAHIFTCSNEPRAYIKNNEWFNTGHEEDIECPPSAKKLKLSYKNGDTLNIEYFELNSIEDFLKKYPQEGTENWRLEFPITAVEICMIAANTPYRFDSKESTIGGGKLKNCFFNNNRVGISIS